MTMTATQGEVWKKIVQVYFQWDPKGSALMPVHALADLLPAVPRELILDTLSRAKESQLAQLDSNGLEDEFRPRQH